MKRFLLLSFFLVSVSSLFAQVSVSGKVTDETGSAMPGVNVLLKGTTSGTTTDADGNFTVQLNGGTILVFSFIGYETQEVNVGSRSTIEVQLLPNVQALNEVVVTGYGTQKKKDLTGSVASISNKDLVPVPTATSVDQMLQGKVAGVQIVQTSGAPGGNVNVIVRGISSITGGNSPLYVIDGYAIGTGGGGSDVSSFASGTYSTSGMVASSGVNRINPLSTINPADIESIQILKDASATAIYGSRGANGVVIITTKRGKQSKPVINFEYTQGVQQLANKIELLTPREYAEFVAEGRDNAWVFAGGNASDPNSVRSGTTYVKPEFRNPEQFADTGYGTDWQDVIFRTGSVQNLQGSVMGSTKDVSYFVSGGYYDQDGIIIGSNFRKFTLRTNIDAQLTSKLKLGSSVAGSYSYGDFARAEGHLQFRGLISAALASDPTIPIYNPDGSYYSEFSSPTGIPVEHPLIIADEFSDKRNSTNVFTNNYLEYEILDGLTLKSSFGVNYTSNNTRLWQSSKVGLATSRTGAAQAAATTISSLNYLNENTINYRHAFGDKHEVDAIAGWTVQKNSENVLQAGATDFPTDLVPFLAAGTVSTGTNYITEWSMLSWLARINYTLAGKYIFTATIRQDGSSRFGSENRWGTFPSFSAAWRLSDENFMKGVSFINDLKLRASYGIAGNNLIPNYASQGLYGISRNVSNGQIVSGVIPTSLANDQLTWEQSVQTNVGLDLSLFQGRVSFVVDAYQALKKDLLLSVQLPAASGFTSSTQNIGEVENKGLELTVNGTVIQKGKFSWTSDFNISWNRNEVIALNSEAARISTSAYQVAEVGYPISSFRLLKILGVFQNAAEVAANPIQHPRTQPGDYRFLDVDGSGGITDADRTIVGNPWPDFTWGFGSRFSYGNFTLNVQLNGSQGNEIYFQGGEVNLNGAGVQNQLAMMADRWKSESDPGAGTMSRAIRNNYAFGFSAASSKFLFDGSFTRIRNVNLSYNVPKSFTDRIRVKSLNVFADVTNLYTFTDYPGYDPEGSTTGDNIAATGVDFFAYPNPRTWSLGVRFAF